MFAAKPIDQLTKFSFTKITHAIFTLLIDGKHAQSRSVHSSNIFHCFSFGWNSTECRQTSAQKLLDSIANTINSKIFGNNEKQTVVWKMLVFFDFDSLQCTCRCWWRVCVFFISMKITSANVHTTDLPILRDTKHFPPRKLWARGKMV